MPTESGRFVGLQGSYGFDGGPITIQQSNPDSTMRVSSVSVMVDAQNQARLTTSGSGPAGGSIAPFSNLVVNSSSIWSVSSPVAAEIDGPVTLDVNFNDIGSYRGHAIGIATTESGSGVFPIGRREPPMDDRLRGSYSTQGPIVIESTDAPMSIRGLEFPNIHTVEFNSTPLFETVEHSGGRWVLRSDSDVILDGEIQIDTQLRASSDTAIAWDGTSSTQFPMTERPAFHVDASYPFGGGRIFVRSDTNFVGSHTIESIEIRAWEGELNGNDSSLPFNVTRNTGTNWSASSESLVKLPASTGWLELNVEATAGTMGEVVVSNGLDEARVPLLRRASVSPGLIGGYSMTGGPVSIASNTPTSIRSLSINALADRGKLTGGDNAHPFETVTTNTPTAWSVESSESVTIDGVVQLDLRVEEGAFLTGETSDGINTTPLIFNGFTEDIQSRWTSNQPIFFAYPEEGGNLMIINGREVEWTFFSSGVEFIARPGVLEAGDDPSPYAFFIPNGAAPGNVTLGSFSIPTFEGVTELDIEVVPNTLEGDIFVATGHSVLPLVLMPSLERFASGNACVVPADHLIGDLDFNGSVEFRDFLILSGNFGFQVDSYADGDINCNGTVDFEDFLRLGNRFGQSRTDAAQSVPEPNASGLLVLGLFVLTRLRKRR